MKKIQKSVLVLLAIAFVMPACKKGENDPTISLRSRKARVAGEWKVSSMEATSTNTYTPTSGSTSTSSETTKIDGTTLTMTESDASGTETSTGTVKTYTYTFDKDGTWKSVMETSFTETNSWGTSITATKHESEGVWNFLGKVGEDKNKENMSVSTTKVTTTTSYTYTATGSSTSDTDNSVSTQTYAANEVVSIWKLTQLKNKEMIAESTEDYSSTGSSNGVSGGMSTTKGSSKIVFSQE